MQIRRMTDAAARGVLAIYAEGIATARATLQADVPDSPTSSAGHRTFYRVVAGEEVTLLGRPALSSVSVRAVDVRTAEVSLPIGAAARGYAVGRTPLRTLRTAARAAGIWMLQAGIVLVSAVRFALYPRLGYCILGIWETSGRMTYGPLAGEWPDRAPLEWPSNNVGAN